MKEHDFDIPAIVAALRTKPQPVVGVLGDFCLDKYLYRDTALDEISVETGLVAWQIRDKKTWSGAAGTIAANLCALGARVMCFGYCGEDGEGFDLLAALKRMDADTTGMIVSPDMLTNTYMKPMVREHDRWIEMNRLDIRNAHPANSNLVEQVATQLEKQLPRLAALVVCDQFTFEAGSILNESMRQRLPRWSQACPDLPILVDSRSNLEAYRDVIVKGNAGEILACCRRLQSQEKKTVVADDDAALRLPELIDAGTQLALRNRKDVLVTRGEKGAILFKTKIQPDVYQGVSPGPQIEAIEIPPFPVEPPIDICGAGDATNAGFAFARAIGLTPEQSALVAGAVSSITIRQLGMTGTASVSQLCNLFEQLQGSSS